MSHPIRELRPDEVRIFSPSDSTRPSGRILRACVMCGEPRYENPLCVACLREYEEARSAWRVIEAIRAYVERYGEPPTAVFFNPQLAKHRTIGPATRLELDRCKEMGAPVGAKSVYLRFGTHNAAIREAGFEPRRKGRKRADRR